MQLIDPKHFIKEIWPIEAFVKEPIGSDKGDKVHKPGHVHDPAIQFVITLKVIVLPVNVSEDPSKPDSLRHLPLSLTLIYSPILSKQKQVQICDNIINKFVVSSHYT